MCCNKGSVLMEFLIVLPIYIVLMGGLFLLGEMVVNSIRNVSSDRLAALGVDSIYVETWSTNTINSSVRLLYGMDTDDGVSLPGRIFGVKYANRKFAGPWTVCASSRAFDSYKAPLWTRGWLSYSDWFLSDATESRRVADEDPMFASLLDGGRIPIYSRTGGHTMSYFTLKRVKRGGAPHWRSNDLGGRALVDARNDVATWYQNVYSEPWHLGNITSAADDYTSPNVSRNDAEYEPCQAFWPYMRERQ